MTDRELLELAAKAYDDAHVKADQPEFTRWIGWNETMSCGVYVRWNPLTDDGDALRLAVKLGLETYHTLNDDEWTAFVGYPADGAIRFAFEGYGNDPCAATRRAIVRAAAAIGGPHA